MCLGIMLAKHVTKTKESSTQCKHCNKVTDGELVNDITDILGEDMKRKTAKEILAESFHGKQQKHRQDYHSGYC